MALLRGSPFRVACRVARGGNGRKLGGVFEFPWAGEEEFFTTAARHTGLLFLTRGVFGPSAAFLFGLCNFTSKL